MSDNEEKETEKYDVRYVEDEASSRGRCFETLSWEQTVALEKRLLRKIDFHLILPLFFLFVFNILDRSNIANARLGGLQKDLGLSDTQYQTAVAIMFVGYLGGQIPSNILLTRLRPSIYIPICILVWGGISMCTAAVKNYGGIIAVRILLGLAESPFFAGALLMISSWYKPSEIAPRVAFMYCGNTIANGFGGLLAAGVLEIGHSSGLTGWRWLYIIEGGSTMLAGVLAYWLLPDFPKTGQKKWLTEEEQRFAEWRLALAANNEVDENGGVRAGIKAALTDVKVWLLVLTQVCLLSSQTWTYFFPSIVKTLGFNTTITLLITAPVYIFGFFTSLGNSLIAQRTGKRAILIAWPLCIDIIGNVMVITSHHTAVRYTGMFLMCAGSYSAFNVVQAWIASTVPRSRTKRAVTYALVNMMGNSANIYGAYFFPSNDAPQYRSGGIALSSFAAGGVVTAVCLALLLRSLNKKAEKVEEEEHGALTLYKYMY